MKLLAFDIGDEWIGTAISDPLGFFARPYQTIKPNELHEFIQTTIETESIKTIIVGHPKTMRGTVSKQTEKVEKLFKELAQTFPNVEWKLWDERLSSKMAATVTRAKTKAEKIRSHSIAAAFILDSYLSYLQTQKKMQ